MASGDSLCFFDPQTIIRPDWLYVAFTSGSAEPTADGDGTAVIWGDSSDANARLEYLQLESGTWGGGDAAGFMLLSNDAGTAWTSGENFTADSTTPGNHGTLTGTPVQCACLMGKRNDKPMARFDDTVNYVAMFQGFMPRHYGGSGVTLTVGVMAATATTLDMSWKAFFMSVSDDADDLDVKNFAGPQSNQAVDAPSAAGEVVYFTITFTNGAQMDSVGAGETFYLLLMRDAQDSTNDDMTGDAQFVFAELQET